MANNETQQALPPLVFEGRIAVQKGAVEMFNVPNPPSSACPNVREDELIAAIDRHSGKSKAQFEALPSAIREKALARLRS